MFLKKLDLTTALRPSYLPDEVLLFVQDNVGLYEGKYKLPKQQKGQVYLTTHRICYVDSDSPRANSVALDLRDVERYEFSARFLKSSPKVTITPKALRRVSLRPHASSANSGRPPGSSTTPPTRSESAYSPPADNSSASSATWVCAICTFSNPVPSNFDPTTASVHTPLPPCLACGIKPNLAQVLKAAITTANQGSALGNSSPSRSITGAHLPGLPDTQGHGNDPDSLPVQDNGNDTTGLTRSASGFTCPRCTFSNHPSLLACEMCGASLINHKQASTEPALASSLDRVESPGPLLDHGRTNGNVDTTDNIKISFRGGGERIFLERLKGSMTQRKWLLQNAPPVPKGLRGTDVAGSDGAAEEQAPRRAKTAGIAGLEQLGLNMRKNNEILIGSAFEDLEALMASAKDIVALAERFARQTNSDEESAALAASASQLGLVTTKDLVGSGATGSESLYLSELSRNLAEFLTDDARGVLKRAGGIITLVDLWAVFNRARGGVELVSPMDFDKAARMWEDLKLPVRLRTFRSGVMVAQAADRTDAATTAALLGWMQDLHDFPPEQELAWDWHSFGRGITPRDAAERFGWSIGVAEEELLMAEDRGALCREEGLAGLKFWKNYIDLGDTKPRRKSPDPVVKALREGGLL